MKDKKFATSNPQPIKAEPVPKHPYMAPNNRSNMHCDAYQTDTYTCPGPGSDNVNLKSKLFSTLNNCPELCPTLTFDSQGRIITVGIWVDPKSDETQHELLLLNPDSLDVLAYHTLPPGSGGSSSFGSGGYIYLNQDDQVVVPCVDGSIGVYEVKENNGSSFFSGVHRYMTGLPQSSSIQAAMPDWSGRIWFVADEGYVGFIDPDNPANSYKIQLKNEQIANSFAVDKTGGVFVVSDHAMYRFDYDDSAENRIKHSWRYTYDRGTEVKPGQKSQGSGTTPTLLNVGESQYVAITDNADPQMHVIVYRREKKFSGNRKVGEQPVFKKKESDTENSLIGAASSFIVENNYGYTAPFNTAPEKETTPGLAQVSFSDSSLKISWDNESLSVPSVVSKVSLPDGLVYTYTLQVENNSAQWYFTAVDFYTGKIYYQMLVGNEAIADNHYAAIALHPDKGYAYVPVNGGIVKVWKVK